MREVYVLGSAVSAFGKHPTGSGRHLAAQVAADALSEAGIDFSAVDGVWAGVALGASPRAVFVAKELGLTGVPVQQVVNASASGLAAVHEARMAIRSGDHDVVIVLGYDVPEYDTSAQEAIARQGFLPPVTQFALWAAQREQEFGTTAEDLARVAAKNWNYARSNPLAARQADAEVTVDDILASKVVAGQLHSKMCTPWGDGAGAIVLASAEGAREIGVIPTTELASSVLRSEIHGRHHTFEGAVVGPREMTTRTSELAFDAAGVRPRDVDVVQVHDAFANEELEYLELMGFVGPGEADKLLRDGAFGPGSRRRFGLPEVSTDGGLLARGHASGGTGVAQIHETRRRFAEHGDRVGVCHLLGAGSVCVMQVLRSVD